MGFQQNKNKNTTQQPNTPGALPAESFYNVTIYVLFKEITEQFHAYSLLLISRLTCNLHFKTYKIIKYIY
jgi:hypothetical protein